MRQNIVAIGEQCIPLGIVRFGKIRNKQASTFQYSSEWLQYPRAYPIAPSLPLDEQRHYFSSAANDTAAALPGAFSDCAPDAWGRAIIERAHGPGFDELDFLLAVDDTTRQGALRFLDDRLVPLAHDAPPTPRLLDLGRLQGLCANLQAGTGDLKEIARELRGATASLGGARPKSVVVDDQGTLYVAKFTMQQDTMPIERAEVATLSLAREVGIRAAGATLAMPNSALPVALIERFDRSRTKQGIQRVNFVSAQTFIDARREDQRFYTDIGDAIRAACRNGETALRELAELHRRILFTILVSNNDDHLKNHGFLYADDGNWVLSPAYDINPQPQRQRQLKTGISELSDFEASVEAWIGAAPFFEVSEDTARELAASMALRISERWRQRFLENGVTEDQCTEYAAAFQHPEMDVALNMGNTSVAASGPDPSSAPKRT